MKRLKRLLLGLIPLFMIIGMLILVASGVIGRLIVIILLLLFLAYLIGGFIEDMLL